MNEQTPRDPQQPIDANDPTPHHGVRQPDAADTSAHTLQQPVQEPAQGSEDAPRRGRGIVKPVLIGAGAAVAILAVAGVGLTVADALDDRGDDDVQGQPGATAPMDPSQAAPQPSDDRGEQGGDDGGPAPMQPEALGAPDALVSAIDAAVAAANGEGATSIETERSGWKVDVLLADGTEVEVLVPSSGDPIVRQDDDDDSSGDATLDTSRIGDIVDAAIAAAGGGTVEKIETERDDSHAFDVQVDLGGDDDVDVELADDLSVVSVD